MYWGYGQNTVCPSYFTEKLITSNSITGNNITNLNYIVDGNGSTRATFIAEGGTWGATTTKNISIKNINYNKNSKFKLQFSESNRGIGTTKYIISLYETAASNSLIKTETYSSPSLDINNNFNLEFHTTKNVARVDITIEAYKTALTQNTIAIYDLKVNEACSQAQLDSYCNNPIPLTKNNYNVSITSDLTILTTGDEPNIIDDDTENSLLWAITGVNYSNYLIESDTTFEAGTYAGFVLTDYAAVAVVTTYTVETYMNNTLVSTVSQQVPIQALVTQNRNIGVVSSGAFNKVKLSISGAGAATFNIYNAYIIKPCASAPITPNLTCNTNTRLNQPNFSAVINYQNGRTGTSGLTVGNITNLNNIVNSNPDDYGSISLGAGIGASALVSVKDLKHIYPAGTFAGFEISNSNLLNVNFLGGSKIITYKNGIKREESTSNNTILNISILGSNGRGEVGFVTTLDYDEIQYVQTNVVALDIFGSTNVYNAIVKKYCEPQGNNVLTCEDNSPYRNKARTITAPNWPVTAYSKVTGISDINVLGNAVTGIDNLVDTNENNFVSVNLTGLGTSIAVGVEKALDPFPSGTYGEFVIRQSSLLNVGALNNISIILYNKQGGIVQTISGNSLLVGANLLQIGQSQAQKIGFKSNVPFNKAEILFSALLNLDVAGSKDIYAFNVIKPCESPLQCDQELSIDMNDRPLIINFARTGVTNGLACALCSTSNHENLIDADRTNFATIYTAAGVGVENSISIKDLANKYPKGTTVAYQIEDSSILPSLNLLESLKITTYLNDVPQESMTASSLINLDGILLSIGAQDKVIGFVTSKQFDEMQISVFGLADLNRTVKVKAIIINSGTVYDPDYNLLCADPEIVAKNDFKIIERDSGNSPRNNSTLSDEFNIITNDYYVVPYGQNIVLENNVSANTRIQSTNPANLPTGITLNPTTGSVTVAQSVPNGRYSFDYTICSLSNPGVCSTANVIIIVTNKDDQDWDNDGIINQNENNCDASTPKVKKELYRQDFGNKSNSDNLSSYVFPKNPADDTSGYNNSMGIRGVLLNGNSEGNSGLPYSNSNPLGEGHYTLTTNSSFVDDYPNANNQWSDITSPYKGIFDHTTGDLYPGENKNPGYMMIVNPRNNADVIWKSPNISIDPFANVEVSLWLARLNKIGSGVAPNLTIEVHNAITYNINSTNSSAISSLQTGDFNDVNIWKEAKITLTTSNLREILIVIRSHKNTNDGNDFAIDDIVVSESYCDTDGDGIPNIIDLDSDGDGCFDALEAVGTTITAAQLDEFGQITGGEGTTGIPLLVVDQVNGNSPGAAYNSADRSACGNIAPTNCIKPHTAPLSIGTTPSFSGITTLETKDQNWPRVIDHGFFALESKDKGLVITRLANTSVIQEPIEGMIIYDKEKSCISIYARKINLDGQLDNAINEWRCIQQNPCLPEIDE